MTGILGYGSYVPHHRLDRGAITAALGAGGGRGTRAVASYDEDPTSMAVEAARRLLRQIDAPDPTAVLFATSAPPYLGKTNATAVHAALQLDAGVAAFDFAGAHRSTAGALHAGISWPGGAIVIGADVTTGLPGGPDEAAGGDAAAALLCGTGPTVADLLGTGSASAEVLDRWRLPGEPASRHWEERFGEQAYTPLAEQAVADACKRAGITADQADHVVLAGSHDRALRRLAGSLGAADAGVFGTDLAWSIGNAGAAALVLGLVDALERSAPGETILAVSVSDGADAFVFRTTERISEVSSEVAVSEHAAREGPTVPYPTFLTWRGLLDREPPRRPDPERPAAPPSFRSQAWKYGFVGSRCEECGTRHLPPHRICLECDTPDRMAPEPLADVQGTIVTYTVDRLAFSLNPPAVVAVIDFDGGGRFQCELTDVDPAAVAIGDRVAMTFRRLFTADGVHNYFWKARPAGRQGG